MSSEISIGQSAQALYENASISARMGYAVESGCSASINTGTLGATDTLTVASGNIFFNGNPVSVSSQSVGIDGGDPDDPRKDVVYLDGNGDAQVAKGTPAQPLQTQVEDNADRFEFYQPTPPALDTTDAVVLAEVWVPTGASSISSGDVAHRRQFATVLPSLETNVDAKGNEISNLGNLGSADGFASLNSDGVLTSSEVPDLSITSTFTVADESERLALDVDEGDVAIQNDNETTYIFTGGDPSLNENWSKIVFDVLGAIDGETITPHEIQNQDYNESVGSTTNPSSGVYDLDLTSANLFSHTLTEATEFTISNATGTPAGNSFTLLITQDGSTQYSITWPTSVEWNNGNAPPDPATGEELEVSFVSYDGGTTWKGRESWGS